MEFRAVMDGAEIKVFMLEENGKVVSFQMELPWIPTSGKNGRRILKNPKTGKRFSAKNTLAIKQAKQIRGAALRAILESPLGEQLPWKGNLEMQVTWLRSKGTVAIRVLPTEPSEDLKLDRDLANIAILACDALQDTFYKNDRQIIRLVQEVVP